MFLQLMKYSDITSNVLIASLDSQGLFFFPNSVQN